MFHEIRIAVVSVWFIVSAILLAVLFSFFVLPESALMSVGETCQLQHSNMKPCPLCGMTRAFISISNGKIHQAIIFNRWSVVLYGIILSNELSVAIFVIVGKYNYSFYYLIAGLSRKNPH